MQWEPFRIRVNADAVAAVLRERLGENVTLTFGDGAIDAVATFGGAPARAHVTIAGVAEREVRIAVTAHARVIPQASGDVVAVDPMIITISLASLLPGFVDVSLAGAEITPEGVIVSLAGGGADPPPL